MEIKPKITKQDLNFVNDIDFKEMLLERLDELDKVSSINANYSTIFLSIGTLEGIFRFVADKFRNKFIPGKFFRLNGTAKTFEELTIDDLYEFLSDLKVIPKINNFEHVFKLFRDYRNFIHPQAQRKKDWPIDLGQGQMALGLLNASIGYLDQQIFVGQEIFKILSGNPSHESERVLRLELSDSRLHSFLLWDRPVDNKLILTFELELPPRSVFNFVFNFANEGSFKMLRLDTREEPGSKNCLLRCDQKYFWREIFYADQEHPPQKHLLPIKIEIDFPNRFFSFFVDGISYVFKDSQGIQKNLFEEIKPNLKIGFFNEVRPLKISNIVIS